MPNAKFLNKAKSSKNDEFYTQLSDIERELKYYKNHFKGKTVFCNCDDPFESNFFKYFVLNFNRLQLKKLICTCYSTSPIAGQQLSLFDVIGEESDTKKAYKAVVTKVYDVTGDGSIDMFDVAELFKRGENELSVLCGDGDFRSEECIELLKECDIVVTNPPFSLFREYVSQLIDYEKSFLLIGNINCVTYKEIFPLIKNNKAWLGNGMGRWISGFIVPEKYELYGTEAEINERGERIVATNNCLWLTNLDIKKRHEELILVKHYSPELYPQYDNYNAIEVSKTVDIPCDYDGYMGVPITFLDKYNPDQFELMWLASGHSKTSMPNDIKNAVGFKPDIKSNQGTTGYGIVNGKQMYHRILIRNKHPEVE